MKLVILAVTALVAAAENRASSGGLYGGQAQYGAPAVPDSQYGGPSSAGSQYRNQATSGSQYGSQKSRSSSGYGLKSRRQPFVSSLKSVYPSASGSSGRSYGQSSSRYGQSSGGYGQSSNGYGQSSSGYGQSSSGYGQQYPPMPYSFSYDVLDVFGNDFGQAEESNGEEVQGQYSVLLPDGRLQTVSYSVTDDSGFVAEVSYEGEAQFVNPYTGEVEGRSNVQRGSGPTGGQGYGKTYQ